MLDEPSSNLDPTSRRELGELIQSLDVTVLMVTHDEKAAAFADRVIRIEKGQLA